MNEKALKQVLQYVYNIGYITADTREKMMQYIHGDASFDIFNEKNKMELSRFYSIMKRAYMEITNEFLPNIFYVEGEE